MNRFLNILFCVLIRLVADAVASTPEEIPQIKATRTQIWYVNPKLINQLSYSIAKRNATFNDIYAVLSINADLPDDVYIETDVYASDKEYKTGTLLLSEDIPVCRDSTDHYLLPEGIKFPVKEIHGQCLKKNQIIVGLVNNFRFEWAIPNIHEISDYHYVSMALRTVEDIAWNVTFYSEWGYLNID